MGAQSRILSTQQVHFKRNELPISLIHNHPAVLIQSRNQTCLPRLLLHHNEKLKNRKEQEIGYSQIVQFNLNKEKYNREIKINFTQMYELLHISCNNNSSITMLHYDMTSL